MTPAEILALVLEQIDLAEENWDTHESDAAGFTALRECIREVLR
jgi:hypothetical protein